MYRTFHMAESYSASKRFILRYTIKKAQTSSRGLRRLLIGHEDYTIISNNLRLLGGDKWAV